MYSCCLRALAKQASQHQQHQIAEVQAGVAATAALASQNASFPRTRHYRQYHSSQPAAYIEPISPSQASTSAVPSSFPSRSTARSTKSGSQAKHYDPSPDQVTSHLNTLFEGLQPPISPELAIRMVTHKGAASPDYATPLLHNTKLSLIGRRVLRLYLAVFLHAHNSTKTLGDAPLNDLLERLAHTHTLGRYVAPRWNLERNMAWREMIGPDGRPTGLEKISGQAVEAILGGLYRQYGAAIALQVFNSRILAFLPLPSDLREPAINLAQKYGDLAATQSEASLSS